MKKNETHDKNTLKYEQLWLQYYNDTLLEKGIITEEEHHKMNTRIVNRKGRIAPLLNPWTARLWQFSGIDFVNK